MRALGCRAMRGTRGFFSPAALWGRFSHVALCGGRKSGSPSLCVSGSDSVFLRLLHEIPPPSYSNTAALRRGLLAPASLDRRGSLEPPASLGKVV